MVNGDMGERGGTQIQRTKRRGSSSSSQIYFFLLRVASLQTRGKNQATPELVNPSYVQRLPSSRGLFNVLDHIYADF